MRNEEFANYLGVDYEKKGGYLRVICPFHADSHPSLVIYPELEKGCYCFACGTACSWAWLAHTIKGISYTTALKELGQDVLPPSKTKNIVKIPEGLTWCDEPNETYMKAFTEKHQSCSKVWPEKMENWLKRKGLYEVAQELDWRWHDKNEPHFKFWGDGIVTYERFRAWNGATMSFEKPKGPFDVGIQPYFTTFRPNSVVMIAEGESDCASLYAHGASVIGIPGACAKKAINTVIAFICDHSVKNGGYIDTVIACGDKDEAGKKMNELIRKSVYEICDGIKVMTYTPESADPKADINDDHAAGLLHIPNKYTCYYGQNYNRQPFADKEFGEAVDKISPILDKVDDLMDEGRKFKKLRDDYAKNYKGDKLEEDLQYKIYDKKYNELRDNFFQLVEEQKNGCLFLKPVL